MTLESFVIWGVLVAIAGFIAGKITKGSGFGIIGNIIVGIVGSFFWSMARKIFTNFWRTSRTVIIC